MSDPQPWLPPGAATDAADAALAELFTAWARHWFAGASGDTPTLRRAEADALRAAGEWLRTGEVAIGIPGGGKGAAGALALGVRKRAGDRTDADRALLAQLGEEGLRDLCIRVAKLCALPPETRWAEAVTPPAPNTVLYWVELGGGGDPMVVLLALPPAALARLVLAGMPSEPRRAPLASAEAALAPTALRLSAVLGHCEVTLAEICELMSGDVLVLDRAIGEALPIAIEHLPARRGRCTVSKQGDTLALQIIEAPVG